VVQKLIYGEGNSGAGGLFVPIVARRAARRGRIKDSDRGRKELAYKQSWEEVVR